MTYTAGGKGIAPRRSTEPAWLGLEVVSKDADLVTFKTRMGTMQVSRADYDRWLSTHPWRNRPMNSGEA